MSQQSRLSLWLRHSPFRSLVLFLALALFSGLYAYVITNLGSQKLALVLIVGTFFVESVVLKHAYGFWFALMVLSLSFSARFRPPGSDFRGGGAELALAPMDFPLILLAVLALLRSPRQPSSAKPSLRPILGSTAFFLVAHLLSVIPAVMPGYAWLEILRLVKMLLFVWVIAYYLDSRRKIVVTVNLLMAMVILQGALAIVQSVFRQSFGLGFLGEHQFWTVSGGGMEIGRAGGTLGHANVLANFLELLTPIGFALILAGVRGRTRFLAAVAVPLGVIGTFFTSSRAGWVALTIGLLLVVIQMRRHLMRPQTLLVISAVGIVIGLVGLAFWITIQARLTVFLGDSALVRQITAQTAINMLRSNLLVGVGANNYIEVSSGYVSPFLSYGLMQIAAAHVHNIILLYAAELGLVGVLAFGVLLLSVWRLARRTVRQDDPFMAPTSVGAIAGVISLVAHGMWDWLFRYDPVYVLFWFIVGLLVAVANVIRREEQCLPRTSATMGSESQAPSQV